MRHSTPRRLAKENLLSHWESDRGKVKSPKMSEAAATLRRKGPPGMAVQNLSLLGWVLRPMHRGGSCFTSAAGLLGTVESFQGRLLETGRDVGQPHPLLVL